MTKFRIIAVKKEIYSENIHITSQFQTVAVKLFLNNPITICSLYLHHDDNVTCDKLSDLVKKTTPSVYSNW